MNNESFGISGNKSENNLVYININSVHEKIVSDCEGDKDKDKDVSFVFTHSHRLRCFLAKLIPKRPDLSEYYNSGEDPHKHERYNPNFRFKNNSVLLLRLYPENDNSVKFKLDLLVNGIDDVDDGKDQWSMVSTDRKNKKGESSDKVFEQRTGFTDVKTKIDKIQYIFLIRHGQATHNLYKKGIRKPFQSVWNRNTKLTNTRESTKSLTDAAEKIGLFFKKLNIPKVDIIFVSDLLRTHETCQQFLTFFLIFKISIPHEFYVLPCSHELHYMNNGDCDGTWGQWRHGMAGENISTCDPEFYKKGPQRQSRRIARLFKSSEPCNEIIINDKKYPLNWNYYAQFYPGGVRGTESERVNYVKCRSNSFLDLLLKINKFEVLPESDTLTNRSSEISADETNLLERDSARITELWKHGKSPHEGGRSHRKSRRKSIRKKRKSIRKRKTRTG